jgi:hypothetical protein
MKDTGPNDIRIVGDALVPEPDGEQRFRTPVAREISASLPGKSWYHQRASAAVIWVRDRSPDSDEGS